MVVTHVITVSTSVDELSGINICVSINLDKSYDFQHCSLNVLRNLICLRKSEVTVERVLFRNVTEKLMEHGMHCLSCSYTNDVIDLLP